MKLFIDKWFCAVSSETRETCLKTADAMLAEMRAHREINRLKDTPLMLTAICLLYNDGKQLPSQRAELYTRFVDNLLSKRFKKDREKVRQYLAHLARRMHFNKIEGVNKKEMKGIDEKDAVAVLRDVYSEVFGDSPQPDNAEMRRLFGWIESQCGLLRLRNGEYQFWHLTYQEFLAAVSLLDLETGDFFAPIEPCLDDDWFKEMIHLYVGCMSVAYNKNRANRIVRRLLEEADEPPFRRWRTGAWCLENIHQDRRNAPEIELARKRMREVMVSAAPPADRDDAGRVLGWLGDDRKDLKDFVEIKGGEYKLSLGDCAIEPFELGKYPVTNDWFREFIEAGGYRTERYWTEEGKKWLAHTGVDLPRFWHDRNWNCPNLPMVGVCWYEARHG